MRKINCIAVLLVTVLFACNDSATKREETQSKVDSSAKDTLKSVIEKKLTPDSSKTITATFVGFDLGDVSHYMFKDESGKTWDFRSDLDSTYKFEVELPKNKSNESNQGFGSNKALQGKSFIITYVLTADDEHPDEDGGKVKVITHVKAK